MELFHNDGHLTDEGLNAILQGELDELQSLEASEHLGYCTPCLERYLGLMEAVPLLQPEAPIQENVLRRIGRKAKRILFSRYATVAAAACLVLALGVSGLYTSMPGAKRADAPLPAASQSSAAQQQGPSLATRLSEAAVELPNTLFGWMSPQTGEAGRNGQDNEDQKPDEGKETENKPNSAPANSEAQDGK